MRPSAPQTGSKMVEEQPQSVLHEASSTSLELLMELYIRVDMIIIIDLMYRCYTF